MRKPRRPPSLGELIRSTRAERLAEIFEIVRQPTHEGKYLHWQDVWNRSAPSELTHEEWWLGLKWNRKSQYKTIPLTDMSGRPFVVATPEQVQQTLHEITQRASGSLGAFYMVTNEEARNRYLVRNLMEEGISSSLIEGAATTREKAKEMLQSKREPRSIGEQMVLNNYAAMQHIIQLGTTPLTPGVVLQLHEIITRGTLDDPSGAGRLRREDEPVDIIDSRDNEVLHVPPHASELRDRMEAMCNFANGKTPEGFVHPVVRSVLLHFWLAYDHPFKDGNGRCARALFYWSMLQHNYWLCQYFSISEVILRAPVQYGRAFLETETDDNDLTYFLFHQLNVIKRVIDQLYEYLDRKLADRRDVERRLRLARSLNERQLDIVAHALRHPHAAYDIRQIAGKYGVVYQTARSDLLDLADKGVLKKTKRGRTYSFYPSPGVERLLDEM